MLSPPQHIAEDFLCTKRDEPYQAADARSSEEEYGRYYAAAFQMKGEGEPVEVYTFWAVDKHVWRMVG
jgi:hypothetical protein